MPEFLIFEPREPDPRRRRGFLAAVGRFVRTVATILGCLALGVGLAIGGYSVVSSSGSRLTSTDKELLQLIAADHPAGERDPFATRWPPKEVTPEESLYGEKFDALLSYSFGLIVLAFSLAAVAGSWFMAADALGYRKGVY